MKIYFHVFTGYRHGLKKLIEDIESSTEKSLNYAGNVLAVSMIIMTNEFKDFPGAAQFACYAGIVPFGRNSGTSLNIKPRISEIENKEIKSLLHVIAMATLRGKSEYKIYYDRKIAEGKNKMVVLNSIRNKIVRRIFSCVQQNRIYE